MAGSGNSQAKRPNPPKGTQSNVKKPLQVMHISRKEEIQKIKTKPNEIIEDKQTKEIKESQSLNPKIPISPTKASEAFRTSQKDDFDFDETREISMADLLAQENLPNSAALSTSGIQQQIPDRLAPLTHAANTSTSTTLPAISQVSTY